MAYEDYTFTVGGQTFTYKKDGVTPGHRFEKWYRCHICGFNYPESEVVFFRGKPYGIPCGCADDIPDIILKERYRRRTNGSNR